MACGRMDSEESLVGTLAQGHCTRERCDDHAKVQDRQLQTGGRGGCLACRLLSRDEAFEKPEV
jgi:hypothetical protein